jgi:cell division protein FtsW (lipid II flippase)
MRRSYLPWIAVALATAIRLLVEPSLLLAAAVAVLAIAALLIARSSVSRVAAIFLLLVAITDTATLLTVQTFSRTFEARSSSHLTRDVARIRQRIHKLEAQGRSRRDVPHARGRGRKQWAWRTDSRRRG